MSAFRRPEVFHHRHSVRPSVGSVGREGSVRRGSVRVFRKEKARLLRVEAKAHMVKNANRRWRLRSTRDDVRIFFEEARATSSGWAPKWQHLAALAAICLVVLFLGDLFNTDAADRVFSVLGTFLLYGAVLLALCYFIGEGDFLLYGDTWHRTGRVRADVHVPASATATFAFVSAPDPVVRREWSPWFEHSVWRSFDAHTALVDTVEIAPPGWLRILGSRPRVSRSIRLWDRDDDGSFTIVSSDATGTEEADGNALPVQHFGVSMATTEDLMVIRPAAFTGGAVVTRVVDCDAKLIYGVLGRTSIGALTWHGRRIADDLTGLRLACGCVLDDDDYGGYSPFDEKRSHFNFGLKQLERSTEFHTSERLDDLSAHTDANAKKKLAPLATGAGELLERPSLTTTIGAVASSARLLHAPSDESHHSVRHKSFSCKYCPAFRAGTPGALARFDSRKPASKWGNFSEPRGQDFRVRGPNYLADKKKIPSEKQLCDLAGLDSLKCTEGPILELGRRPGGIMSRLAQLPDADTQFVLIINFVLPTPTYYVSMAGYFVAPTEEAVEDDPEAQKLRARLMEFCSDKMTDAQRDDVLKIVPRLVEGPWVAKHAVGQKPALLGHAIKLQYSSGPGWFEMDVDVSSSSMATGVLRILKGVSKSLIMDLAFVLEGQKDEDLPERVIGTLSFRHFDLNPDNSPLIKLQDADN